MKLIESGNLSRHIRASRTIPVPRRTLISKIARAVHHAHQRMILHRDIKPSNILRDRARRAVYHRLRAGQTDRARRRHGADVDSRGDGHARLHAAGAGPRNQVSDDFGRHLQPGRQLYETLTGQPPFKGESSADILRQVLDHEPARPRSINSKLDRDLETICLKCLQKEPSRRYSSAAALADDLDRWGAGLPIAARPVPMWERTIKWVKRKPAIAALVLTVPLGLLALIGGGIWFTLELRQERNLANRGRYAADMNLARRRSTKDRSTRSASS